jgi:hypothetical protein
MYPTSQVPLILSEGVFDAYKRQPIHVIGLRSNKV